MAEFDYIIVGGGSSGCVVAKGLSENPANRVLLIESGRRDSDPWIHIPATFFKVLSKGRDIHPYASNPQKGLNGRPSVTPQGNVLGGGSSVNAMIYIRGHRNDYDTWAQMGCRGWSYADVLPAFRSLEDNESLDGDFHGQSGDLHVSNPRHRHPLSEAFIQAATEIGIPRNPDFNGADQAGVGFYQSTTYRGRRWSSAQAFLRDAEKRPNVTVLTERKVARVLFEGRRATGVELTDGTVFRAVREVVLTAGAIATPQILQRSGIGDGAHLSSLGIEVVADLPGVGANYQDHLEVPVQGETREPISILGHDKGLRAVGHMARYLVSHRGLLASNVVECGGFVDTAGTGQPDVQFHVLPVLIGFLDREPEPGHGLSIGPCYLRPRSRGTIRLKTANPNDKPEFDANLLSDPADIETLVRGVETAIRILEAPALAKLVKRRVLPRPGIEKDPVALRDYIRQTAKTVFHPAGTARMGHEDDRLAVVGNDLKVRGVEGLRVCDASVMPTLVSGNTNAPVMMIAARCAAFMTGKERAA
ncbi:GMC family oxidoreductase [Pseudaminobacter soli (ex Li et al. 2025)]|uniref:GMC family oxidoreductase n=1 Tax=Pseudaminobacter soli (ex Li et al. 2025) TaxID=1295366 RepID=A0A2P7S1W6_9HYPH|nr:GMC family oxidoreductase N-terminal domain-containing protein [Mesorhizobium soli]PSJ56467.1 GMC family oxidoreductase [Mesorhizobium soli]